MTAYTRSADGLDVAYELLARPARLLLDHPPVRRGRPRRARRVGHGVEDMAAAPPEIAAEVLWHAVRYEPTVAAAVPALAVPVFALNSAYRPNDVGNLRTHGVETVLMDGVGHFLTIEAPDRFNALLEGVLGRIAQP